MTNSLPLFHRIAGQTVIVLGQGDGAEARRRLVERAGGVAVDEADTTARLAFLAITDEGGTLAALARLRARGLLVNVMDRPDLSDFFVPSLLERGPVQVAVGTGGASAGLAKALRLRLETVLPSALGTLAERLGAARPALKARIPDASARRQALDAALSSGGALDPLDPGSAERVAGWVAEGRSAAPLAAVIEIRLRSPDPDDLTLHEARLLGSADRLAYEAGIAPVLLARARADAHRQLLAPGEVPDPGGFGMGGLTVILRAG